MTGTISRDEAANGHLWDKGCREVDDNAAQTSILTGSDEQANKTPKLAKK